MSIKGIKHKDKRPHIPSHEEAGTEAHSLGTDKTELALPLNPVTHRGQDPELWWLDKYGADNADSELKVDIRSLYRHEHIAPEVLIQRLYSLKESKPDQQQSEMFVNELFGNALAIDELDKPGSYYTHQDGWSNRLIQGDSLLVMTSLLEREGLAGKVQMIYLDPPYGIKYGSNWQMRLNDRNVKDGSDEALTGEGEVIKAFRDTWELGIHSYLSYMRDRLLVAKQLLTESGSCFVQISDENVHLVRCLMDEIFGSENFVSLVTFAKTTGFSGVTLSSVSDYLVWYGKDVRVTKYRQLFREKRAGDEGASSYKTLSELPVPKSLIDVFGQTRLATSDQLTSQGASGQTVNQDFEFEGKRWLPPKGLHWKTTVDGLTKLNSKNRIFRVGNTLRYLRLIEDFPVFPINNSWSDTGVAGFTGEKVYVVQTTRKVIERCLLMATDPGDLVLDPTCGSGTTAAVAEEWGRRWVTIDTSRIALNIAKTRLTTATFPWYVLLDERRAEEVAKAKKGSLQLNGHADIRNGFVYKKVPHVTLKSLANDELPDEETLYDQPERDNKRLRVAGPFTVETLQAFEPLAPELLDVAAPQAESLERFEQRVFEHLKSAGIKNGAKKEQAVFQRIDRLANTWLHAEGFYGTAAGDRKAYLHIGPQFGTVSKQAVNEAVKECRRRGDADWLVLLGFAFESDIDNRAETMRVGSFEVSKVRMHDDLMQEGLLKKDKKAASFMTIGEPDIALVDAGKGMKAVEVRGLDIYDPVRDEVKERSIADINYWMVDDDYDGANFVVRQIFFCGGDKDEFDKWRRGLSDLARQSIRRNAERTLKVEIDDEAFQRVYGFRSHPFAATKGRKIAVRVISQFGEESTKVLGFD